MHKTLYFLVVFFAVITTNSQELNCLVTVNAEQVEGSNRQVFTTLERALNEYINQTQWTSRNVKPEERINCAMTIIISSRNDNRFTATLQVQSTRPVFGASYASPILNIKDNEFNFTYNEFDPLIYNENSFDSNLVSTIVFYTHIILGVDADTFTNYGGDTYLKEAENVMLQAQQSGLASWQNTVGKRNRYLLIDNLLSPNLRDFRNVMYNYHRNGFDNFSSNSQKAKQAIEDAVISLDKIHNKTVGNYLIRLFFDAKVDEIVNVYSEGPATRNISKLNSVVKKLSPTNNNKWRKIN